MKNGIRFGLAALAVSLTIFASALTAHAQATRTWVSGVGDDVNPCSRTAPCKTFAGAITKTAIGGEICALDPGGYGFVTITKSVTLDGSGVIAGIAVPSFTGITINLTDPKDTNKSVRIRGLSIDGFGNGVTGINIVAANSVVIEATWIDGFANGITARAGSVFMKHSSIRNNHENGVNLSGGDIAFMNVSVVFNGAAMVGNYPSMTWFNDVVLYGNKKGDGKPPGVK